VHSRVDETGNDLGNAVPIIIIHYSWSLIRGCRLIRPGLNVIKENKSRHAVPRVEPDGPRGYLEMVLPVYGPLVSYVPDGD
jgi:hypothetical protein